MESVPAEWVEEIRHRLAAGRTFKEAASGISAANAELCLLGRKQRAKKRKKRSKA